MDKPLKIGFMVTVGIVAAALVFGAGLVVGRSFFGSGSVNAFGMPMFSNFRAGSEQNFPDGGYSMMRNGQGMMGGYQYNPDLAAGEMTVTPEQAMQYAQQYLDQQFPGSQTAEDADAFYGYYTIDILKDGQPTGMLSVNGFSGQVYYHSWHGSFIEMCE